MESMRVYEKWKREKGKTYWSLTEHHYPQRLLW
jgi:hypothetical protein